DDEVFTSVVLNQKNREYEVTVDSSGTIVQIAMELQPKEVAEPVLQGLKKKFPDAKITGASEVTEPEMNNSKTYHLEIETKAKKVYEVILSPKGVILQKEEVKILKEVKPKL